MEYIGYDSASLPCSAGFYSVSRICLDVCASTSSDVDTMIWIRGVPSLLLRRGASRPPSSIQSLSQGQVGLYHAGRKDQSLSWSGANCPYPEIQDHSTRPETAFRHDGRGTARERAGKRKRERKNHEPLSQLSGVDVDAVGALSELSVPRSSCGCACCGRSCDDVYGGDVSRRGSPSAEFEQTSHARRGAPTDCV